MSDDSKHLPYWRAERQDGKGRAERSSFTTETVGLVPF
jgi:hypothetical protein